MRFTMREALWLLASALGLGVFDGVSGAPFLNADQPFPINVPNRPEQSGCSVYIFGEQGGRDAFLGQDSQYEPVIAVSQEAQPEPLFAHAQGSAMTLPVGDIASARIYVHCGGNLAFNKVLDANGKSKIQPAPSDDAEFNFVEFTITAGRIYVDISAVDMVARPSLGYKLESVANAHTGKQVWGPSPNAVDSVCAELRAQSAQDGLPWSQLCVETGGKVTRVLSPGEYMKTHPAAFSEYFTPYARSVYAQWATQPKIYDLGNLGIMTCVGSADGSSASCNGRPYALPTAADVFGCATGPFAPVAPNTPHEALRAPFCADFHRGTALSDEAGPTRNWYADAVHNGARVGYAFPFDDVRVGGKATDGTLTSLESTGLTVNVGGTWPMGS